MRSLKMVAAVALLASSVVYAQSKIVYTLELGGDNNADLYETGLMPTFVSGASSGIYDVPVDGSNPDVTWAVRVSVGGMHVGVPGDQLFTLGAANLVFDLHLLDDQGQLVADFGAADMSCVPAGAFQDCTPTNAGFWSSMNDGDDAGGFGLDLEANAAFAIAIHNQGPGYPSGDPRYRLVDAAPEGPHFDYGWYPTANARGGIDIGGTKAINYTVSTVGGKLVGFGAGYKSYEYTNYRPGVGKAIMGGFFGTDGFGAFVDDDAPGSDDPLTPPAGVVERPLFEGQISTRGMAAGTYTLKIVPSVDGNNVLHGEVIWDSTTPDYSGKGSFAAKANEVHALPRDPNTFEHIGLQFTVPPPPPGNPTIVARHVFYNQCAFDGNRVAIDAAPVVGVNNDDGDAVDTTLAPLMAGGGMISTFVNYTTYAKGINGLVYDIADLDSGNLPVASDFAFDWMGRTGALTAVPQSAVDLKIWPGAGQDGSDRVFISFANNSMFNGWLRVTVTNGFGAVPEEHWWGNALGEAKNDPNSMIVNALDLSLIKANYTSPGQAVVTWNWDFDKNRTCNALDVSYSKGKFNVPPSTAVSRITR